MSSSRQARTSTNDDSDGLPAPDSRETTVFRVLPLAEN